MSGRAVQWLAWIFTLTVTALAVAAWVGLFDGDFGALSIYTFFPLLGLLAFSIMLAHYVASMVRQLAGVEYRALSSYFRSTSYFVLVCILLHPGLLTYQLWRDGVGLPPGSVKRYVAEGSYVFVILGIIALMVFLAFELHRKFRDRRWWWMIERASDSGMILVYIHALELGSNLQHGWYRVVWYVYGGLLAVSLAYAWYKLLQQRQSTVSR